MPTGLKLSHLLYKSIGIILLGVVVGLVHNALSPNRITLRGSWSSKMASDSLVVPYSYKEGDPPAVSLDYAMMRFQSQRTIFLDARYPGDFKAGHVKGAINLPYEELEQYASRVLPKLPQDGQIIAYCDGSECEASLLLSRELRQRGYLNVKVFFGGWAEWQKSGLPIETGE
jgi:rhodanese-related sulfurtransferase